jgi:hypothetical protein
MLAINGQKWSAGIEFKKKIGTSLESYRVTQSKSNEYYVEGRSVIESLLKS